MSTKIELEIPEISTDTKLTTQEYVYRRLRNAIMVGAIEPGTSLTMRGLAETLGLSPTPIREAIRRLSSEHAIEVLSNRRMTVPLMTLGRFDELVALKVAMEVHAAQRALPYVSDVVIERMTEVDNRMDVCVARNELDQLTLMNHTFHRILYSTNPDQASMPIIESVWLQLGPYQRQVIKRLKEYYLVDRHKEILSALKSRNAAALGVAIERDIRDGIVKSGGELLSQLSAAA